MKSLVMIVQLLLQSDWFTTTFCLFKFYSVAIYVLESRVIVNVRQKLLMVRKSAWARWVCPVGPISFCIILETPWVSYLSLFLNLVLRYVVLCSLLAGGVHTDYSEQWTTLSILKTTVSVDFKWFHTQVYVYKQTNKHADTQSANYQHKHAIYTCVL